MKDSKEEIINFLRSIKNEFEEEGIIKIALFGSHATQKSTLYSDIDIAIQKDRDYFRKKGVYSYFDTIEKLKKRVFSRFQKKVDIFDLDSSGPIKKRIESEMIHVE